MQTFFRYNWIIREQWYEWCEDLSLEELLKPRTGGVGGVLQTLFHVVDVEWSWIRALQGKPDFQESFDGYRTLEKVKQLDRDFRQEVEDFVNSWHESMDTRLFYEAYPDGGFMKESWGAIMRHTIAHHIHHMGQLSVWAREIGKNPVSANLIRKGLLTPIE